MTHKQQVATTQLLMGRHEGDEAEVAAEVPTDVDSNGGEGVAGKVKNWVLGLWLSFWW